MKLTSHRTYLVRPVYVTKDEADRTRESQKEAELQRELEAKRKLEEEAALAGMHCTSILSASKASNCYSQL